MHLRWCVLNETDVAIITSCVCVCVCVHACMHVCMGVIRFSVIIICNSVYIFLHLTAMNSCLLERGGWAEAVCIFWYRCHLVVLSLREPTCKHWEHAKFCVEVFYALYIIMCYVWVKLHCMGKLLATPITQTPHFYQCSIAKKMSTPHLLVLLTFPANCILIHSSQFNEQGQQVTSASTLTGDGDRGFKRKNCFHNAVTKSHPSHLQQNQTCSEIKVCDWLQVNIHFVVCYTHYRLHAEFNKQPAAHKVEQSIIIKF